VPVETEALVIGSGVTRIGILRDFALHGVHCLLIDKKDLCAGCPSGGNHEMLHSGSRYALSDPNSAVECREEGALFKRLATQCIEDTEGLFVGVRGDEEIFAPRFSELCQITGIRGEA
jgi:glycerol-3-phosphate dehydrogenase